MKIAIILDYPRLEYFRKNTLDYGSSQEGRNFKHELFSLGLKEGIDYKYLYLYDKVPLPATVGKNGRVLSYKSPSNVELKKRYPEFDATLDELNSEVVIATGTLATKHLLGIGITKCQGAGYKVAGKPYYCLPLYRQGYVEAQPNLKLQRDIGLRLLADYVKNGITAFKSNKAKSYGEPMTIDEFEHQVANCKTTGELSWDLETNTLNLNIPNAKVLIFSFAWAEGKASSLFLEHKEIYSKTGITILGKPSRWTPDELKHLYHDINIVINAKTVGDIPWASEEPDRELPSGTTLIKVGHNIKFDLGFLLGTKHISWANNVTDTKVGYWLEVSQEEKVTKRLSTLAFGLTSMGGYDQPLEDYKVWLLKTFKVAEKLLKAKIGTGKHKKEDYNLGDTDTDRQDLVDAIDWDYAHKHKFWFDGLEHWVVDILTIPKINKYRKAKDILNEADPVASGSKNNFSYEWNPSDIMGYYAAGDSDCCLRIHHKLLSMMKKDHKDPKHRLIYLYLDYYAKMTTAFSLLEHWGMRADKDYMKEVAVKYDEEKTHLLAEMRKFDAVKELEADKQALYEAGLAEWRKPPKERYSSIAKLRNRYKDGKVAFNPKSVDDKSLLLFDKLGYTLPYAKGYIKDKYWSSNKGESKVTSADYKTDKLALDYIEEQAEKSHSQDDVTLISLLRQYSKVATIQSGFTTKLYKLISPIDGNVHGSYNISGTGTSRISSSSPNLQQLPAHTSDTERFDYKYPIKRMFISQFKGGKLFNMDYSNLEMRVMGLVTKEPSMTNAFLVGHDIHKDNASMAFNVPYDKVTKEQRHAAKKIGFGLIYGIGTQKLSEQIGESTEKAEDLTKQFYKSKPLVKKFIEETHELVHRQGYVNTVIGFRRDLNDVISTERSRVSEAERQSVNTIIQGTGASLTNMANYLIVKMIHDCHLKSRIFVTVHDSIGLDCPPDEIPAVPEAALYLMTHIPFDWLFIDYKGKHIRYPIDADLEVGDNYNDMVEYNSKDYKSFANAENYITYYRHLNYLSDLKESGKLEENKYNDLVKYVESLKPKYQASVDNLK